MKVRLQGRARADLRAIGQELLERAGQASAERVRKHLERRILALGRKPDLGRKSKEPRIWILAPTQYPYRIYYAIEGDTVFVLPIRHTSRREPDLTEFQ